MKKLIVILAFMLFLASCASNTAEKNVTEQIDSTQVVIDSTQTAVDSTVVEVK